jgi:hypothetical protein
MSYLLMNPRRMRGWRRTPTESFDPPPALIRVFIN